jgi:undecaprenyl pyrophosphate synthase
MNDLERFMRSAEGAAHLEEIRRMLEDRTITKVTFSNEVHFIATTLHLDDGETFFINQPSLEVEALREQFEEVIEREYYVDFPERKPEGA